MTSQDFILSSNTTAVPMRRWSAYEQNQLRKYGVSIETATQFGDMPVEYITGWVTFCDADFMVDPSVLIPRVETEDLVELVRQKIFSLVAENPDSEITIADVGTGSGAIGLSVAMAAATLKQKVRVILSDISTQSLDLAKKNAQQLAEKNLLSLSQLDFIESDLLLSYPNELQLSIVVANLPYIPTAHMLTLADSVKLFEPHSALDGGEDGFGVIRRLLEQLLSLNSLVPTVFLETDSSHTVKNVTDVTTRYTAVQHADGYGRPRFLQLDAAK